MKVKPLPPVEFLRECFDYNPDTGELLWKERPREHFKSDHSRNVWVNTHAGMPAALSLNAEGYRYVHLRYQGKSKQYLAHRIIWKIVTGEEPPPLIDHDNTDGSDNRWLNLREANKSQNAANVPLTTTAKSGFRGVVPTPKGRFQATITCKGVRHYLGTFDTAEEAHSIYVSTRQQLFGEFAHAG